MAGWSSTQTTSLGPVTRSTLPIGMSAALSGALSVFAKSANVRDLIVALTKSRVFTHRTPSMGEVLQ